MFKQISEWFEEHWTVPDEIKEEDINKVTVYCTRCGTKYMLKYVKGLKKYDFHTGNRIFLVKYACPFNHESIILSTE